MTIDSTWLHAFKEDSPHAFTPSAPFRPYATFVDGQIKLMQAVRREPLTWDQFIFNQFTRHLKKWFEVSDVVVLAFDNYDLVPRAKSMTQCKRRKHIPPIPFSEHSELPAMVPEGERWMQCIANRTFKTRVIDLVILRLPHLLLPPGEAHSRKRLIIDYHEPRMFWFNPQEGRPTSQLMDELPALGEADVKFTRYADLYGKLMVDSIDGDSVPIALLHLERAMRSTTPQRIPETCIHRMQLNTVKTERTAGAKRSTPDGDTKARREKATYEFVHVNALYQGLKQAVAQSIGRVVIPTHQGHEMGMLVALIALTGTDFSRNLPQVSGRSVFGFLPSIWGALIQAYDPATGQLDVHVAADVLVSRIYHVKFPKQLSPSTEGSLEAALTRLRGEGGGPSSKLAPRVRDSLPTAARVVCSIRNANWVLKYWGWNMDEPHPVPDPVQPTYGFQRLPNGATEYADACPV
jgi:hypothetical protein